MNFDFRNVRPKWHLPPYPPYHVGLYLEEYFFNKYLQHKDMFDKTGRTLIPIFWTSCYMRGIEVQPYIDVLPKDDKYFTVSQHDDAIKEKLPPDTISFCAGGNGGGIPIPLICSPIPHTYTHEDWNELIDQKTITCSFVGSLTHHVRHKMYDALKEYKEYTFITNEWSFAVDKNLQDTFFDITKKSYFTLCPRGYGAQSFRFYEAIQLHSVPIYVHDDNKWLPFENDIDYNSFCIIIHIKDINSLPNIIENINKTEYISMLVKGQEAYKKYFTMEAVYNQIYKYLNEQKRTDS